MVVRPLCLSLVALVLERQTPYVRIPTANLW